MLHICGKKKELEKAARFTELHQSHNTVSYLFFTADAWRTKIDSAEATACRPK